eukprot:6493073-Heterocapsa_arctica.AAC.1
MAHVPVRLVREGDLEASFYVYGRVARGARAACRLQPPVAAALRLHLDNAGAPRLLESPPDSRRALAVVR